MLNIMTLGFVLTALMVSGIVSVAETEPIPTPLRQVQDGTPTIEVVCAGGRILMLSPGGDPACAFVGSAHALMSRGFELLGELPFEAFLTPPESFSSEGLLPGPPPDVRMSRLPNINETATVEIRFTSNLEINITDTERNRSEGSFVTGWRVSPGFEIVDSGGLQYEPVYLPGTEQIEHYEYVAFTPLNVGETKTYRVEIRAVEEGYGYVVGLSYAWSEMYIHMYLDDEETLFYAEHRERYPELHERPPAARSASDNMTDELKRQLDELIKNPPPPAPIPIWEESRAFFTEWIIAEGYTIEEAAGFLATDLFLSADRIREVLALAGFPQDEIDGVAPADNGTTARSTHQSFFCTWPDNQ